VLRRAVEATRISFPFCEPSIHSLKTPNSGLWVLDYSLLRSAGAFDEQNASGSYLSRCRHGLGSSAEWQPLCLPLSARGAARPACSSSFLSSPLPIMANNEEIDNHILQRFEILQKLGKGVRFAWSRCCWRPCRVCFVPSRAALFILG